MGMALEWVLVSPLWFFLLSPMYNVPRIAKGPTTVQKRPTSLQKGLLCSLVGLFRSLVGLVCLHSAQPSSPHPPSLSPSPSLTLFPPVSPSHGAQVRATHVLDSLVVELARAGASSNRPLKLADIWQSRFSGGAASK